MFISSLLGCGLLSLVNAQFPPKPEGVTVLQSKFHENVTLSYKEPGICETTPGVKSYSGYVHLPPGFLDDDTQDYPINTFFWFFESRKDPLNAPLAIWLNGGPGGSSIMGLLEENGPCFVGPDSKTTHLNPWSWNNEVNLLYIDQPNQVGFSYDLPTNCTIVWDREELEFATIPADFTDGVPETNFTNLVGTFSSQKHTQTANSTSKAAHALWHFAQTFFFEFPYYKPNDNRVSIWTESYGGHYGPGFMRFFQEQNAKIANGSSAEEGAHEIHLDTLGIVNGLLDVLVQGEAYITLPYNNTYGIQIFNQTIYEGLTNEWTRPGGGKDTLRACQKYWNGKSLISLLEEERKMLELCDNTLGNATSMYMNGLADEDGAGWYDIAHGRADPFPSPEMYGYLTQESVLSALGVPVNYSKSSHAVGDGFGRTADITTMGLTEAVGYLLDSGIKVAMMYGDRDYACNWVGGEQASLAVPYSRSEDFANAGYSPLLTPDGFTGMTRQLGNFSFTRVFQAGHEVPSYQPIAAYEVFMRATSNRDISTGLLPTTDDYFTIGPKDTWHIKNVPPPKPEPKCYVLKPESCPRDVFEKVATGKVVVKDWFVVSEMEDDVVSPSDPWLDSDSVQDVISEL